MTVTTQTMRIALACALSFGAGSAAFAQDSSLAALQAYNADLPPDAKEGECYARVFIPGTTKRVANKVLVKEATEKLVVVPAVYETITETVVTETEGERLEIIPAVYINETKTVVVEPEREVQETVEAIYEEAEEKVKIREAYTTWKKGEGPIQRYDEATGEIMCLVTVPAEYETVTKRVVKVPPRTITRVIPAKTETLTVKVMKEPPKTRTINIPAKSREVSVQRLVTPASIRRIEIPAQYETVYEVQKAEQGKMEWRPILCNTNASPEMIRRLQVALREEGYNPGTIDGVLGGGTMEAVRRYQRTKGIAQGQLTIETLKDLGVYGGV